MSDTSNALKSQLSLFEHPRAGPREPPSIERRTDDSLPSLKAQTQDLPKMTFDELPMVDEQDNDSVEGMNAGVEELAEINAQALAPAMTVASSESPGQSVEASAPGESDLVGEGEVALSGMGLAARNPQPDAGPVSTLAEGIITVMVRPIPSTCTQRMLIRMLDGMGFVNEYDYVYVPMDARVRAARGFAFINFVSTATAQRFHTFLQGKVVELFSNSTPVDVMPASVQGFEENVLAYIKKGCRAPNQPIFLRPFSPTVVKMLNQLGLSHKVKSGRSKLVTREELHGQQEAHGAQQPRARLPECEQPQSRPDPSPLARPSAGQVSSRLIDRLAAIQGHGVRDVHPAGMTALPRASPAPETLTAHIRDLIALDAQRTMEKLTHPAHDLEALAASRMMETHGAPSRAFGMMTEKPPALARDLEALVASRMMETHGAPSRAFGMMTEKPPALARDLEALAASRVMDMMDMHSASAHAPGMMMEKQPPTIARDQKSAAASRMTAEHQLGYAGMETSFDPFDADSVHGGQHQDMQVQRWLQGRLGGAAPARGDIDQLQASHQASQVQKLLEGRPGPLLAATLSSCRRAAGPSSDFLLPRHFQPSM